MGALSPVQPKSPGVESTRMSTVTNPTKTNKKPTTKHPKPATKHQTPETATNHKLPDTCYLILDTCFLILKIKKNEFISGGVARSCIFCLKMIRFRMLRVGKGDSDGGNALITKNSVVKQFEYFTQRDISNYDPTNSQTFAHV